MENLDQNCSQLVPGALLNAAPLPEVSTSAVAQVISHEAPLCLRPCALTGAQLRCKQAVDLVLGFLLLLVALPFMAVIWVAIRVDSKGPGMIVQNRIGYKGRAFKFYKFRTMYWGCTDSAHRAYIKDWMDNRPADQGTVFEMAPTVVTRWSRTSLATRPSSAVRFCLQLMLSWRWAGAVASPSERGASFEVAVAR